MRLLKILAVSAAALSLATPAIAQGNKFDFDYRTNDERVQVFDDGKSTRIQFPAGTMVPTILAVEPKGEVLLQPTIEATYLVVPGIYSKIVMRWGNKREVTAIYGGGAATARQGNAAAFGAATLQASYGSVAKPMDAQIPVRTSPSAGEVLVPRVSAEVVVAVAAASVPTVPSLRLFTFKSTDKTVEGTFARWAEESKLGKKVVWRVTGGKPPLDALGEFEAKDAIEAMTRVASAFENTSNPFVVEEYDNVVLVVARINARLQSTK